MAQRRVRQDNRRQQIYAEQGTAYIHGSAVRKLDERGSAQRRSAYTEPLEREPVAERERRRKEAIRRQKEQARREQNRRETLQAARKNRAKAHNMNLAYVLFLTVTLSVVGVLLLGYIALQWNITKQVKINANLKSTLNTLKEKNDERYTLIQSSEDLEEIKRIAIQELGMGYAEEGQIITFSGEGSDYMRQVADIPE